MLWYKAWLETRWRLILPAVMILFVLFSAQSRGQLHFRPPSMLNTLPVFWLIAPITLAGAGIRTEAPFRAAKGISGSVSFTLSLPVSRLRLLAVRACVGIAEWSTLVVFLCVASWLIFPELRVGTNAADGLGYIATVLAFGFAMYSYSTVLSTFLDQQMQVVAAMATIMAPRLLNAQWDAFRSMGLASSLVTHTIPGMVIGTALAIGAAGFVVTARIIQNQEY